MSSKFPPETILLCTTPRRRLEVQPDVTALEAANLAVILSVGRMATSAAEVWEAALNLKVDRHFKIMETPEKP